MEPLINAEQACEVLTGYGYRISVKRLYQWAADKKLPSIKEGKYRYFRRSDLETWFANRTKAQPE